MVACAFLTANQTIDPDPVTGLAAAPPGVLAPVFRSPINGAALYAINGAALEAALR